MYHDMYGDGDGWAWFWMVPLMLLWVVVLGGVVYGAVRLALQHNHQTKALTRARRRLFEQPPG